MRKTFVRLCFLCAFSASLAVAPAGQQALAQAPTGQALPLEQLLEKVRVKYNINLLYEPRVIAGKTSRYSIPANASAEAVLREMLTPLNLRMAKVDDKNYAILGVEMAAVTKPATEADAKAGANGGQQATVSGQSMVQGALTTGSSTDKRTVTGRVVAAEDGQPLSRASVMVKGTKTGVAAGKNGEFSIDLPAGANVLVVNFVGYKAAEVLVADRTDLTIKLEATAATGSDVVVMGIINRKKESFTGATASFTAEELKVVGNQNIIEGLRALDPSFIVNENNLAGSNPNQLPDIEIRGKTSVDMRALRDEFSSDPNQPLFILDGFETSLRTIVDLDMNRVESVNILKDAASTAIYGARAANGVVVIETRKPKSGTLQLYYNNDTRIEAPDLSVYNLMNAEEKLEFERLSGRYNIYSATLHAQQMELDKLYNSRLERVRKGVDTYWMNEPLQTGFAIGNSLRAEGGDGRMRYGAGVQYKYQEGAMKGSGRQTWGINMDLIYRSGKFNVQNKLFVNGFDATESPYGSFSGFAQANPYYEKYNANGGIDKYLEVSPSRTLSTERVVNPLYNAGLNNKNETTNFAFQNNLQLTYTISRSLQAQGGLQVNKGDNVQTMFTPPEHSKFDNASIYEKGSYSNRQWSSLSYQAFAMMTYGKLFGEKHQVNSNLRAEMQENQNTSYLTTAVGFPAGSNGNPAYAFGYQPDGRPTTATSTFRRTNFLLSGSYTFNRRYVADFSIRLDGSTAFGSNKKYQPFWSGGVAWNLHQERFMAGAKWVNSLRLKANTGLTGNQNFGSITSVSVYNYYSDINMFGQGVTLTTLGNPNLEWQSTMQSNIGADFSLFKNRFSGFVNVYRKYTDPLIVVVDLPASTGLTGFPTNIGFLDNRGIEANIRYNIINKPNQRKIWSVGFTGINQKSHYGGIGNSLENLNKSQQQSNSMIRFKDGYSPDDLWSVYSHGIDPSSGKEVFLKQNGQYTYDYDPKDIAVVGNMRPWMEGVFNTSLTMKGFSFSFFMRYRFGGEVLNTALFNKVENISDANVMYNQDKRALYDRWKTPGDRAMFKNIGLVGAGGSLGATASSLSSRFVQEENTLAGESISLGYDFDGAKWLRKAGMRSLRLKAYMNDVFRLSSIQRERGIDYPFTRSFSFSINTSF